MKIPNSVGIGAGIGIGTVQLIAIEKYLPGQLWPVFGNICIGGIAVIASFFVKALKKNGVQYGVMSYGFTTLFGGLISGIMEAAAPPPPAARGLGMRNRAPSQAAGYNGYLTHEYYPNVYGRFVRRPQSRARGFASDVTVNPMASIPTTVPYNRIIA